MATPTPNIRELWASDWSLTVLLVLLLGHFFLLAPLRELGYDVKLLSSLVFTLLLLSGSVAVARSRLAALAFGAVALVAVGVHWTHFLTGDMGLFDPDAIASLIACGLLSGIVFAQVFRAGPITSRRIQGAIAAYLLIALMFAVVHMWIDLRSGGAFGGAVAPRDGDLHPTARFAYFSFVTLTTVGYGDIVPVQPFARSMAADRATLSGRAAGAAGVDAGGRTTTRRRRGGLRVGWDSSRFRIPTRSPPGRGGPSSGARGPGAAAPTRACAGAGRG